MKKQWKWICLSTFATTLLLTVTACQQATPNTDTQISTPKSNESAVPQGSTEPKEDNQSKGDANIMTTPNDTNGTITPSTSDQDKATDENRTITPSSDDSDIDAVHYVTRDVVKKQSELEAHVVVTGETADVAKFILPYTDIVKDLNKGTTNVTAKIYSSEENYKEKKPTWAFKDGILTML